MTSLGAKIRDLRHERNLTLRALCDVAGITIAHLSDVELGRRNPSVRLLKNLAGKLGVAVDDLLKCDSRFYSNELKKIVEQNPDAAPEILAAAKKIAKQHRAT